MLGERTGHKARWIREEEDDEAVQKAIESLLGRELTDESAVQIALLRNPDLQALYEDLGVAQAEVVQAGLLRNPVFSGTVRFPHGGGAKTNNEFDVSQEFLDLLFLPARKKIAAREFERVKLRVAGEVTRFVSETRIAFYGAVAADSKAKTLEISARAAGAAAEFAARQFDAGTLRALDALGQRAFYEQENAELEQARAEALAGGEQLRRLMGLSGSKVALLLPESLPPPQGTPAAIEELETLALERSLEIAAARKEREAVEHLVSLTRNWRYVGGLEAGISHERDPDGGKVTGPSFQVEIPLFDQKQAAIARLEAELRRSTQLLESRTEEVRARVREGVARLTAAQRVAGNYARVILPLRKKIEEESLLYYNGMLLGLYDLLFAKQETIRAEQARVMALRDYWVARAQLEQAIGGKIPATGTGAEQPKEEPPAASPPQSPHQHHHH